MKIPMDPSAPTVEVVGGRQFGAVETTQPVDRDLGSSQLVERFLFESDDPFWGERCSECLVGW